MAGERVGYIDRLFVHSMNRLARNLMGLRQLVQDFSAK